MITALERAAESWLGTPFVPNSCVKGAGVACHELLGAIYRESGWLPDLPALPAGSPAHARASNRSLMVAWLQGPGAKWFDLVQPPIEPGDTLLINCTHLPHHAALALPDGRAVHVSVRHGVQIIPVIPKRIAAHITHIFRPREQRPHQT